MSSDTITDALRRFPLLAYLEEVSATGRQAIDADHRRAAAALHDWADGLLSFHTSLNRDTRDVLVLVTDLLYTEKFLLEHSRPRYVSYANLRLLDRHLLENQAVPLKAKWQAAKQTLALVIRDWHEKEQDRLSAYLTGKGDTTVLGFEHHRPKAPNPVAHLQERERSLAALSRYAAVEGLPDTQIILNNVHLCSSDWSYFAKEPGMQVAHLTCMPRSRWHDEYMFLRTIHATECCFAGILAGFAAMPPLIKQRNFTEATEILKGTLFFSAFLTKLFATFSTMPVDHFFSGFREATGDGSAIQSVRFQSLEVLTRGLGDHKRSALATQPEVGFTANWSPPAEATLAGMCQTANECGADGNEFLEKAAILDRDLYKWRTKHLGIAKEYLPPSTIGTGAEGVPYLEATYKIPRLPSGTPHGEETMQTSDRQLARCSLSFGLRPEGSPVVAVLRATNVGVSSIEAALPQIKEEVSLLIKKQTAEIQGAVDAFKTFFGSRPYPIERQLDTFNRRGLPADPIAALLLSLELTSGFLLGVHNAANVHGQVVFDTASEGESFETISRKSIRCADGELIVRDQHGIIASVFQGPDYRTKVVLPEPTKTATCLFLIFGYPGVPRLRFEKVLNDLRSLVKQIGALEDGTWLSYEH